jgi:hypothetical protein
VVFVVLLVVSFFFLFNNGLMVLGWFSSLCWGWKRLEFEGDIRSLISG